MEINKNYELKVIGAGLPRTGTMSMKSALEILGFGPCYHMKDNFQNGDFNLWTDYYENKTRDWGKVFKNYKSTVDAPGCFFWEELLKENPDAKIILTVRDNAEVWFSSCSETVFNQVDKSRHTLADRIMIALIPRLRKAHRFFDVLLDKFNRDISKEGCVKFYENYIKDVKDKAPKDKLLVFNVKEGWEPLCKFLNVPVPKEDFPKVNDRVEFNNRIKKFKFGFFVISSVLVGLLSGGIYLLNKKFIK